MEDVLRENIASELKSRGIRLAELSRLSGIATSTLHDLMDENKNPTAKITTVMGIASGLRIPIGKLLGDKELPMSQEDALKILRISDRISLALAVRLSALDRICADEDKLRSLDRLLSEFAEDSVGKRKDSGSSRG